MSHECDGPDCCVKAETEPTEQELRERLAFLEDRLNHFREMLAWRNGQRLKAEARVERLERELRRRKRRSTASDRAVEQGFDLPTVKQSAHVFDVFTGKRACEE